MKFAYTEKTQQILNEITNNPQQAYILHGSRGSGKYLASLNLAASIIGEDKIIDVDNFTHPNLFIIKPTISKKAITITQIRELNDSIWRTSSGTSEHKVVIIVGVDILTKEAANALLKNLEDTPKNTIFILITNMISQVLPTIRSRSQLVFFEPLPIELATDFLFNKVNITREEAKVLISLAHGSLGDSIELIDSERRDYRESIDKLAKDFLKGNITQRFFVAKIVYTNNSTQDFLDALIYEIRRESTILGDVLNLENIMNAIKQLNTNINQRTILENLSLQLSPLKEKS